MPKNLHACACEDIAVGGAWPREMPRPEEVNKKQAKFLIRCAQCRGYVIVSVDGQGQSTIMAPTKENLLDYFHAWLERKAKISNLTPEEIAGRIGKEYEKAKSAGCFQCLAVLPDSNPEFLTLLENGNWESLYQCPACGAYRWLTYETHGFAELPVWGTPRREDIKRFRDYIARESAKRAITEEEMAEFVFQNAV